LARPDALKKFIQISGGNNEKDTPVPIPNTEVKLLSADDTWLETARENRSPPDLYQDPEQQSSGSCFSRQQGFEFCFSMAVYFSVCVYTSMHVFIPCVCILLCMCFLCVCIFLCLCFPMPLLSHAFAFPCLCFPMPLLSHACALPYLCFLFTCTFDRCCAQKIN
jgi:hypothetical protein